MILILFVLDFLGDRAAPGFAVPPPPAACEPADLAQGHADMVASGRLFFVVEGVVAPDADISDLPDGPWRTMATFDGVRMEADGSTVPLDDVRVMIDGTCEAGDCGGLVPGAPQVAFALFDDGGLRIETRPCAATPVAATDEVRATISACVTGGGCGG